MAKKKDITRIEDLGEFHHEDDHETDELLAESDHTEPPSFAKDQLDHEESFESIETSFSDEEKYSDQALDESSFEINEAETEFQAHDDNDESFDSLEKETVYEETHQSNDNDTLEVFDKDEQDNFHLSKTDEKDESRKDNELKDNELNINAYEFNNEVENTIDNNEDDLLEDTDKLEPLPPMTPKEVQAPQELKSKPIPPKETYNIKELSYGTLGVGHGPPFSILISISNNKNNEKVEDLLTKHSVINETNHDDFIRRIENGEVLISQLSEYSAIYLSHQLKQLRVQVEVGLSHLIHQSENYSENENSGVAGVTQLNANKQVFSKNFKNIIISTSESPIELSHENLGTVQASRLLNEYQMQKIPALNDQSDLEKSKDYLEYKDIFEELIEEIKYQAKQKGANLVANANFQITPVLIDSKNNESQQYHLFFQGSLIKL